MTIQCSICMQLVTAGVDGEAALPYLIDGAARHMGERHPEQLAQLSLLTGQALAALCLQPFQSVDPAFGESSARFLQQTIEQFQALHFSVVTRRFEVAQQPELSPSL